MADSIAAHARSVIFYSASTWELMIFPMTYSHRILENFLGDVSFEDLAQTLGTFKVIP